MKFVAKCLAFLSLSYQVHIKVCNPIPLPAFCQVEIFEHAQNFPSDKTDITGQGADSTDKLVN